MSKENKLQLFEEQSVRTHWDEEQDKWFFSIVDMLALVEGRDVSTGDEIGYNSPIKE